MKSFYVAKFAEMDEDPISSKRISNKVRECSFDKECPKIISLYLIGIFKISLVDQVPRYRASTITIP